MRIVRIFCAGPIAGALGLSVFAAMNVCAHAQQSTKPPLKATVTYEDQSSQTCEEQNANNPYTGMNPMVCYGEMAPQDSRGECSLSGMTVWKHTGETCYYCKAIDPPIVGIIVPMDEVAAAESQGWGCGGDQTDACMAICRGGSTYTPPLGGEVKGGGPGLPPTPKPPQGGPPPNYKPQPGPPEPSQLPPGGTPCEPFGPGGYNYCANPAGTQPAGCVCSQQTPRQPAPSQPAPQQSAAAANQKLLADAQAILQNAGKISKQMTDAMDVTKHNNVGIGVAVGACFGAAGKLMGMVAQEYKVIAAANAIAVAQKAPIVQIADEAAAESTTLAGQAEQTIAQAGKTPVSGPGGGPVGSPGETPFGSGTPGGGGIDYQEGMVFKGVAGAPAQGEIPICGVLSCQRIAQLLNKNVPTLRLLSTGIGPKGLTPQQIVAALARIGIKATVGPGATKAEAFTNMMDQVRKGNPVIAGLYSTGSASSPLHAVVIEGLEDQAGVTGLSIYDPAGWQYWQPITSLQKYFTGEFVMPL
jgi:hypothetical protein